MHIPIIHMVWYSVHVDHTEMTFRMYTVRVTLQTGTGPLQYCLLHALRNRQFCFMQSHFQDREQFSNFGWHSSWRIACLWRLWHADVGRFLWITERHHASKLCNRYLEMVQGSRTNLPRLNYQLVIQLAKSSISRLLINASEQWIWHFVCHGRHIQSSARSIKL